MIINEAHFSSMLTFGWNEVERYITDSTNRVCISTTYFLCLWVFQFSPNRLNVFVKSREISTQTGTPLPNLVFFNLAASTAIFFLSTALGRSLLLLLLEGSSRSPSLLFVLFCFVQTCMLSSPGYQQFLGSYSTIWMESTSQKVQKSTGYMIFQSLSRFPSMTSKYIY